MGQLGKATFGNGVGWVNSAQSVSLWLEQRKSSEPEESMENINCVSRSVADSSLLILTVKDEVFKGLLIDPVLFLHHAHC